MFDLHEGTDGRPDDEPLWRDPADHLKRNVVGTELDPSRTTGDGHVGPVVDQERDANRPQDRPPNSGQFPWCRLPQPHEDARGPTTLSGLTERNQVSTLDQLVVNHQHQAEQGSYIEGHARRI